MPAMEDHPSLVFLSGRVRFAIPVERVVRVVGATSFSTLPGAKLPILGIVNVHGRAAPLLDLREPGDGSVVGLSDRFVVVNGEHTLIVLLAEKIVGVRQTPLDGLVPIAGLSHIASMFRGVSQLDDDLVVICDVDYLVREAAGVLDALHQQGHEP
ncbi:MAG: chemotaxis protein CheW [Pseudomonadota bacterium]|nr:chemotaxis protein CheW [Pseudomonadota bacterium]